MNCGAACLRSPGVATVTIARRGATERRLNIHFRHLLDLVERCEQSPNAVRFYDDADPREVRWIFRGRL